MRGPVSNSCRATAFSSGCGANKVIEIDAAGKILWEVAAMDPTSVIRLPNGNTLVACCFGNALIEFDRAGKQVWSLKLNSVFCARRY